MTTLRVTPEGVKIEGELLVQEIPVLINQGYALIDQATKEITFDLAQVTRADSTSLALLIDWLRYAKEHQKVLRFQHLPDKLMQMMKLSNLNL